VVRVLASASALAIASLLAIDARAEERSIALEWEAPPGCPTRELVEERIAHVVGGRGARRTLRARALLIGMDDGSFHAEVELAAGGEHAARHVEGSSCSAVTDAVVLIVALAVEPEAPAAAPTPAPAPTPTATPEVERTEAPTRPTGGVRAAQVFVSVAARLDVSSLPAPAFGGEAALGIRRRQLEIAVDGALVAVAQATLSDNRAVGADIRLSEIGTRGCYGLLDGRMAVGPCAGLHARWLSAQGFGTARPREASALFGVASFGILGRASLSPSLALRASVDAMVPLSRPAFEIDGGESVYRVPTAAVRGALGAELRF